MYEGPGFNLHSIFFRPEKRKEKRRRAGRPALSESMGGRERLHGGDRGRRKVFQTCVFLAKYFSFSASSFRPTLPFLFLRGEGGGRLRWVAHDTFFGPRLLLLRRCWVRWTKHPLSLDSCSVAFLLLVSPSFCLSVRRPRKKKDLCVFSIPLLFLALGDGKGSGGRRDRKTIEFMMSR